MLKMKPTSQIIARLGVQTGGPAQRFFCNECYRYMAQFVPGGMNSHLNQNVSLATDGSFVMYNGPDAHYLYNGNLYVDPKYGKGAFFSEDYGFWSRPGITKISTDRQLNYHTPGTGAHWDNLMWTSKGNEIIKNVQKFVDRGCK
ncbi:MAG TPA: hypothetical protein DDW20_05595 [Firmicutes bacterium]|nr:hypothetical protein [Bacillota bacterium]